MEAPTSHNPIKFRKVNRFLHAVTFVLLVVFFAMSMGAGAQIQIWESGREQVQLSITVRDTVRLEVGDSFVYEVTVNPPDAEVKPVADVSMVCEEVYQENQQPDKRYFRITALTEGAATGGAASGYQSVSFPVEIVRGVSMLDRAQNYASSTEWLILTDLKKQRVGIFKGERGNWQTVQEYACSSGAPGYETPTGEFTVQERGPWFFNKELDSGARWWVRFDGPYLFHSLEMDENKNVKDTRLGMPLSHGCVRMEIAEAKWLHDNVPSGSKVVVY